jgi:predicted nucleic acid-binding protein
VYFDTSYIAKVYLPEPESHRVHDLIRGGNTIHSSAWAVAELHAVLHRSVRERNASPRHVHDLASRFLHDIETGVWSLIPVGEALLRRTSALILSAPRNLFLRAADAVHLTTAQELGERDVWTNDRHMLAAADYFGLRGRSV